MNSFKNYKEYENILVKNVTILNCINPEETNIKDRRFNAVCECGNKRTVRQYDIVHRQKLRCKPCGWKQTGLKKIKADAGLNKVVLHIKNSAKRRGIEFNLTKEQILEITSKNCDYCDRQPELKAIGTNYISRHINKSQYIYNSIDRIDSNKGYVYDNCAPCCKQCNIAKSILTVEEFANMIKNIYNYLSSKGIINV